mgnify:CR=1 FL=1
MKKFSVDNLVFTEKRHKRHKKGPEIPSFETHLRLRSRLFQLSTERQEVLRRSSFARRSAGTDPLLVIFRSVCSSVSEHSTDNFISPSTAFSSIVRWFEARSGAKIFSYTLQKIAENTRLIRSAEANAGRRDSVRKSTCSLLPVR